MAFRQHKLLWASSYDRGLQHLLKMWPDIKKAYPDATLDIFYGWGLFATRFADNPERMAWMDRINNQMQQDGITHHGRVGKKELNDATKKCGIWAYPTDFDEINCITALNCQKYGCVPCVINKAALKETVGSGVKVDGDIYDPETYDLYLKELLDLMGDEKRWKQEQKKGKVFAKDFGWSLIADSWIQEFTDL